MAFFTDGRDDYFSWYLDLEGLPARLLSRDGLRLGRWVGWLAPLCAAGAAVAALAGVATQVAPLPAWRKAMIAGAGCALATLVVTGVITFAVQLPNLRRPGLVDAKRYTLRTAPSVAFESIWLAGFLAISCVVMGTSEPDDLPSTLLALAGVGTIGAVFIWRMAGVLRHAQRARFSSTGSDTP